ncbi:hypothetical protein [Streptomyces sp. NPDC057238]|uniref:hypothetical protein n=1 Tax=Streptomyces sp. NPDC057238 TaxID=3346060 RepID=UPI0036358846
MLKEVTGTRCDVPLREGGSSPGPAKAGDLGACALKLSGWRRGPAVMWLCL